MNVQLPLPQNTHTHSHRKSALTFVA
jgi:hypothetical protein